MKDLISWDPTPGIAKQMELGVEIRHFAKVE